LKYRDPKIHENVKNAMFIRGGHTSNIVSQVLKDLYMLKKPNGIMFKKRNDTRPFEDESSVEFFSQKNDCSLFTFVSHSKKRPHNLILGRTFNYHLLDMIELGVENFKPINSFKGSACVIGSKPCFIFNGEAFGQNETFEKFSNLLVDFFRGEQLSKIDLQSLDHVFICTAIQNKIHFRHYTIHLKKSGIKLPIIDLEECGPSIDFTVRRVKFASRDLLAQATKVPREIQPKKVKNVSADFRGKIGTVHKGKQELQKIQTRKVKALKKKRNREEPAEEENKDADATNKKQKND